MLKLTGWKPVDLTFWWTLNSKPNMQQANRYMSSRNDTTTGAAW
jgi:hypothetical protein